MAHPLGDRRRAAHRPAHRDDLAGAPASGARYRACLGILRLGKLYPTSGVEASAARALAIHAHSYRSFKSILERGLDQLALELESQTAPGPAHLHVRGARYFTDDARTH